MINQDSNNDIDFVYQDVIEIDFEEFVIQHIINSNIWIASHNDKELFEDDIILEDLDQGIIFEEQMIFDNMLITKEMFESYKQLLF